MKNYYDYLYTKELTLNLDAINQSCTDMYNLILNNFPDDGEGFSGTGSNYGSATTKVYHKYNLMLYALPEFNNLYHSIKDMFSEVALPNEPHYMQCWLNMFTKGEFINWHRHWHRDYNAWHGFYCVNVEKEESWTDYRIPNQEELRIPSKDNLLVLGKSADDTHRSSKWKNEHPRITIAFDILPERKIEPFSLLNHWVPL